MSTSTAVDLEAGKAEPDATLPQKSVSPSPSSTLHRVISPERKRQIRGEVPIELVGAILEKGDAFVVTYENELDPRNPQNWP